MFLEQRFLVLRLWAKNVDEEHKEQLVLEFVFYTFHILQQPSYYWRPSFAYKGQSFFKRTVITTHAQN